MTSISIMIFGQIADITGAGYIEMDAVADTDQLVQNLAARCPAIQQAKYAIAVDKKIIKENTPLTSKSLVALLPPFSGG